jgi:hypothetical protein
MPKTIQYTYNTLGSKPRNTFSYMNILYTYRFGEELQGIYSQKHIRVHDISFETWRSIA